MVLIAMNCLVSIRMWDSDLPPITQVSMGRGASGTDLPPQRLLIEPLASQAATQLCLPTPLETSAASSLAWTLTSFVHFLFQVEAPTSSASRQYNLQPSLVLDHTTSLVLDCTTFDLPGSGLCNLQCSLVLDCATSNVVQCIPHILQTPLIPDPTIFNSLSF